MRGKIAVVLLPLMLLACVPPQPPQQAAVAPPPPPPPPPPLVASAPPAPVDRVVAIRRVNCERYLELSAEDRASATMFYIGYYASRRGSATIDVGSIPNMQAWALNYCVAYPNRTVAQAFADAYGRGPF